MCEQDTRKIINEIRASFGAPPTTMTDEQIEAGREVYGAKLDYDMAVIDEVQDSRAQIEDDIDSYRDEECHDYLHVPVYRVHSWLKRQEEITELNCRMDYEDMRDYLQAQVDKLTEERDELRRERNVAIGKANYLERFAAEELAKLLCENDTIEVYDDKIHGKRRLVTGTQRKLEKQIAEMQEAIDAMSNGQFYAMYLKACEERDHFKDLAITKQTK